jgi:mannose-6-phosphate isomerase-like protein (cupin superfamily)
MPPALLIRSSAATRDPALQTRGDRKHLVTQIYAQSETQADTIEWSHVDPSTKCPVQLMPDTECAVFNERAKQTRHCHRRGTEIYLVIEGAMSIEVEGTIYQLGAGDMIVVNADAWHEVKREGRFLCRVISVNCGGAADRFEQ